MGALETGSCPTPAWAPKPTRTLVHGPPSAASSFFRLAVGSGPSRGGFSCMTSLYHPGAAIVSCSLLTTHPFMSLAALGCRLLETFDTTRFPHHTCILLYILRTLAAVSACGCFALAGIWLGSSGSFDARHTRRHPRFRTCANPSH